MDTTAGAFDFSSSYIYIYSGFLRNVGKPVPEYEASYVCSICSSDVH
jgi:hypothetical protein